MSTLIAYKKDTGEGIIEVSGKKYYFPFPYSDEDMQQLTDTQSDVIIHRNNFSFSDGSLNSIDSITEYLTQQYLKKHRNQVETKSYSSTYQNAAVEDVEIYLEYARKLINEKRFDSAKNLLDKIRTCPLLDKTSTKANKKLIKEYFFVKKHFVEYPPQKNLSSKGKQEIYTILISKIQNAKKSICVLSTLTTINHDKRPEDLVTALKNYYKEIRKKVNKNSNIQYSRGLVCRDKAIKNSNPNYVFQHILEILENQKTPKNFKLYRLDKNSIDYNYMLIDNNLLILEYHRVNKDNERFPYAYKIFSSEKDGQEFIDMFVEQMNQDLKNKCTQLYRDEMLAILNKSSLENANSTSAPIFL